VTITATESEISYAGNGVTVAFAIPFAFDTSSDIKVLSTVDATGNISELTTGWATTGGAGSTGTLTFTTAPASGITITILDDPDITQPTDYTNNDAFPAESHEVALDRQTRISKRLYQLIKRCLRTADGDPIDGDAMILGSVANRKGKYLFFNAITGAIEYAANIVTTTLSQSIIGQLYRPQSAAELAASITPTNYFREYGDPRRYGALVDGATDDTAAFNKSLLQAYQSSGADPIWPAGTAVISQLTITGAVHIRTNGYATIIQQKSGLGTDKQLIIINASNVLIEPLSVKGNITTDPDEYNHGVKIGGSSLSNVTLQGVKATNIRGDAVYISGTPANPVSNVVLGPINGTNIYRNVVGFVGVRGCDVESITGANIGYRLFDVEPNAASTHENTGIRIAYVKGSNMLFAGDPLIPNGSISIDYAEMDNSLHADSTPGYPTHPSAAGNIPVIIGNTQSLRLGFLKVRGYGERVINDTASTIKCRLLIDYFDCDTSNTTEVTFKTLIEGSTLESVTINGGVVVLQAVDRYLCKDIRCDIKDMVISGGAIAASASRCSFKNLTINASTLASNLFSSINSSTFDGVTFSNDASATLMLSCSNNVFRDCTAAPGTLVNSGTNHMALKSTLNGVLYDFYMFPSGSLACGQSGTSPVIVNGSTITTDGVGTARVSPGGAVTGIILQAGTRSGQELTVINESTGANTITFAAAATSNVADGVTTTISGLRCGKFTWSSATARWYRS
jgi:hypothetical protein